MIQQVVIGGRLLACVSAAVSVACPLGASAWADHHGNGRHNRTTVSYRSPTHNRGYQHTSNSNAGGVSNVQNALCRGAYVCHVTQNITIVRPEKPEPPAEPPPEPLPEPLAEPAPAPEVVQQAPAGPFVHIGPYGIELGGGGRPGLALPFSLGMFE